MFVCVYVCMCALPVNMYMCVCVHMCMWVGTAGPTWGVISRARGSKLERLFCHVLVKRSVRTLIFGLSSSVQGCHPRWDGLYMYVHICTCMRMGMYIYIYIYMQMRIYVYM